MAEVLTDKSLMPYGQHKGKKMCDVPAKDLIWLYENDRASAAVKEYVKSNWDFLVSEINQRS